MPKGDKGLCRQSAFDLFLFEFSKRQASSFPSPAHVVTLRAEAATGGNHLDRIAAGNPTKESHRMQEVPATTQFQAPSIGIETRDVETKREARWKLQRERGDADHW